MADTVAARGRDDFEAALRKVGERYWHTHPFHDDLHTGRLDKSQLQIWVSNRWYYQKSLPQKDAAIIANCPLAEVRQRWIGRILYQDGRVPGEGGLHSWLSLADAVGLGREEVLDERHVVPGVRFAVDAYMTFARTKPWVEAVATSLTELFSPDLMRDRLTALQQHYDWIRPSGHEYFASRVDEAPKDASYALGVVLDHCRTREKQNAAIGALHVKCDVLWAMLDALDYVARGRPT